MPVMRLSDVVMDVSCSYGLYELPARLPNSWSCAVHLMSSTRVSQGVSVTAVYSSNWRLPDSGVGKTAGFEGGVTGETVRNLCDEGHVKEAVEALGVLVQAGYSVSKAVFYAVLKSCVRKKDLVLGRRVHAFIVLNGYHTDTFLGNHVLRMYASHGRLQDAMEVFTLVDTPDCFTWSAIISTHVKQGQDKCAIQLYHRMRRSGVGPDGHVFVAALQACASESDLETGQQVHADVLASGAVSNLFVCNCLVSMYAKCGSLRDARRVFDGVAVKDAVTWNAMIAGYSQQGMGQEALRLYGLMQEEGSAVPNSVTFVCLLQACASVGTPALEMGKKLHVDIAEQGYRADESVASSLVNMYAKCGSLEDAQRVFDGLSRKEVVTWTALIAGYSQHGMGQEALRLYSVMREEGIAVPNSVTFVCLLQACASVATQGLEMGKQLHAEIRDKGLEADLFVASGLVNMYAKCGSLEDAQSVFDGLGEKDHVTWTSLMAGYSQQGMGQEALRLYRRMQAEGIAKPNSVTFVCLLQACASVGHSALEMGKELHAEITDQGYQANDFVASSLVNMYAKCGSMEDAQSVFDRLCKKDGVTWSALIAGYSQHGMGKEALRHYSAMKEEGMAELNSTTLVCLMQACSSVGTPALETGKQLHRGIRERGHQDDVFLASSLISMYAKCGSLQDAQRVFDQLGEKDVVTWNAMIAGYSQQGMGQEALRLYSAMQEGVCVPDSVTFLCILQACASMGTLALEKGKQLHVQIRERGHEADVCVANSLVNMYAKCGSLKDAQRVFDALCVKDVVTWNVLIAGYSQRGMGQEALRLYSVMQDESIDAPDAVTFACLLQACASLGTPALEMGKHLNARVSEQGYLSDVFVANSLVHMYAKCGGLDDAQRVFDGLGQKDVVTWTALIAGYSQQGMGQEALRLYRAMQGGVSVPNSITFVCLLQACADVAALDLGRQLHAQIEEQGLQGDLILAGSLINMYGKAGSMFDAQQVFDALPEKDIVTWSAMIAGYTSQGDSDVVFALLQKMIEDGRQPVGITFLSVLTVCSHAGLVNQGREYFEAMGRDFSITPTVEHYTCMVDLLGRAGKLDEALALLRTSPILPNAAVWHTLLGACRKWSNVEVGHHAFTEALKLDKEDAAAYMLMSNVYTSAQMWEEAQKLQNMRIITKVWKQPGQSWWTDMDGLVHSFLVGDTKPVDIQARSQRVVRMERQVHVPQLGAHISDDSHKCV